MSSKEISLLGWFYALPKPFRYPLLVLIVSIPFVVGVFFFEMSWLLPYQALAVATVIVIQVWNARRSFNKCVNCGHERHMHDKEDMIKKGFPMLNSCVCDNFEHDVKGFTNPNYQNRYWNGQDPRSDIGGV